MIPSKEEEVPCQLILFDFLISLGKYIR